jgi:hypothetical protein
VCPKRPQVGVNVRRGEVSGRGEVPSVGANLDGEGGAVGKVENHGLRRVHPPARLDLPVLYGRYRFPDGLENRLQFVLGAGRADYLGVFSPLLACWLSIRAPWASCGRPHTFRLRASYYPRLAVSPLPGAVKRRRPCRVLPATGHIARQPKERTHSGCQLRQLRYLRRLLL